MAFKDSSVDRFLAELASAAPTPGGGGVAALCGALGAALVSMTANLTVGREKYKSVWPEMETLVRRCAQMREKFAALMDDDAEAFASYMDAVRMPKLNAVERDERERAMGRAAKRSTIVPLKTAELCAEMASFAIEAAEKGNKSVLSDAVTAALLAEIASEAASYNVRVNLPGVRDDVFAEDAALRLVAALKKIRASSERARELMEESLGPLDVDDPRR